MTPTAILIVSTYAIVATLIIKERVQSARNAIVKLIFSENRSLHEKIDKFLVEIGRLEDEVAELKVQINELTNEEI